MSHMSDFVYIQNIYYSIIIYVVVHIQTKWYTSHIFKYMHPFIRLNYIKLMIFDYSFTYKMVILYSLA